MAFKEVVLTEEEQKGGAKFKKFEAVGDTIIAVLVRVEQVTKTFNASEGPKTFTKYLFYSKNDGEFEVSPAPTDLERKLKKAMRAESDGGEGLEPGMGHLVKMKFTGTQDTGQTSPMKLTSVAVDKDFKPLTPLPASVVWAKQKTGSSYTDDIPF